jgi:gamma-glutamylcyclotransferase
VLYFAYDANIAPTRMSALAPKAEFRFIAHLPEWKMEYSIRNGSGGLPSVRPEPGNTVWGAVFAVVNGDLARIDAAEAAEGRIRATAQAMDREGKRHDVITHVGQKKARSILIPEPDYVRLMVAGGRHWKLPAGWVAALEEHLA